MTATNGNAQAGFPFPLQAGDRAEFQASESGHTAFNGACRVVRVLVPGVDFDPAKVEQMYQVMCLNGGARNGHEFSAFASELTR